MRLDEESISEDFATITQSVNKIVSQRDIAVQALIQIAQGKGDEDTFWISAISLADMALMKISDIK